MAEITITLVRIAHCLAAIERFGSEEDRAHAAQARSAFEQIAKLHGATLPTAIDDDQVADSAYLAFINGCDTLWDRFDPERRRELAAAFDQLTKPIANVHAAAESRGCRSCSQPLRETLQSR